MRRPQRSGRVLLALFASRISSRFAWAIRQAKRQQHCRLQLHKTSKTAAKGTRRKRDRRRIGEGFPRTPQAGFCASSHKVISPVRKTQINFGRFVPSWVLVNSIHVLLRGSREPPRARRMSRSARLGTQIIAYDWAIRMGYRRSLLDCSCQSTRPGAQEPLCSRLMAPAASLLLLALRGHQRCSAFH